MDGKQVQQGSKYVGGVVRVKEVNKTEGFEVKEEKTRNVRATHHFVFVLVPPGRIRGSNNLCVCRDDSDSAGEVTVR